MILPVAPTISSDFQKCLITYAKRKTLDVVVSARSKSDGQTHSSLSHLSYQLPGAVRLDISLPTEDKHGPIHWVYEVNHLKFLGYDSARNVYVQRQAGNPYGFLAAFDTALGFAPQPVSNLLTLSKFRNFMKPLIGARGWKLSVKPGLRTWSLKEGGNNFQFNFTSDYLLKSVHNRSKANILDWNFVYSDSKIVKPIEVPPTARRVAAFVVPPVPVVYKDAGAQKVVAGTVSAFDKLRDFHLHIVDGDVSTEFYHVGTGYLAVLPNAEWIFDKGVLTVRVGSTLYQGKAAEYGVATYLNRLTIAPPRIIQSLIEEQNFPQQLFTDRYEVRLVGNVGEGDTSRALLQMIGPSVKIGIEVDGLSRLRKIESTSYDEKGHSIFNSVSKFDYLPSEEMTISAASLLKGQTTKPLPHPAALPKKKI